MLNDVFIGHLFGKDGQLEVVDWRGHKSKCGEKLYTVKCRYCAEDYELYGLAEYLSSKFHLLEGKLPCGCSKSPRLTKEQYEVLINRRAEDSGYTVNGFVSEFVNSKTKLDITCQMCESNWTSTPIESFLKGTGCNTCAIKRRGLIKRKPDSVLIESFKKNGRYVGCEFWRSSRKNSRGNFDYWNYSCPSCSVDDFVDNKLCTGIFETSTGDLQSGKLSCRCATNFRWSKEQRILSINKLFASEGSLYTFVKWVDDKPKKATIRCPTHGEWNTCLMNLLHTTRRCQKCAKNGYNSSKDGYLYVLDIEGAATFTGYGISNKWEQRLQQHSCSLRKAGSSIETAHIFKTSGTSAKELENLLSKRFPNTPQPISGFMTEATYSSMFNTVVSFAEDWLEQHPASF